MPSDRAARLEARNAKKAEQEAQRLARTTPNMVNTPPPSPRSQAAAAAAAAATVGTGQAAGMGQAAGAGQAVGTGQAAGAGQVAGVGQAGNIAQQQGGGLTMVQITPPLRGGVVQFGTHQVPWTGGSPGVLQEPASHAAFRSQDSLKDAMKSEETCQEPLEEHSRLGCPITRMMQQLHLPNGLRTLKCTCGTLAWMQCSLCAKTPMSPRTLTCWKNGTGSPTTRSTSG